MGKYLVLIYGYARSGKTTLLNTLESQGFLVLSTSVELDYITVDLVKLPRCFIKVLREKNDEVLRQYIAKNLKAIYPLDNPHRTCRDLKIWAAEEVFVPYYGRNTLVKETIYNQFDPCYSGDLVFMETIGGEEAELIKDYWKSRYTEASPIIEINIRRSTEEKGVDIRELSPTGYLFHDKYNSTELYAKKFLAAVKQAQKLL